MQALTGEPTPPLEAAPPPQGPVARLEPLPAALLRPAGAPTTTDKVETLGPVIGAVVAVLAVLVLAAVALLWRRRQRQRQRQHLEQADASARKQEVSVRPRAHGVP